MNMENVKNAMKDIILQVMEILVLLMKIVFMGIRILEYVFLVRKNII
jgi:hypothetical protein